MKTTDAGALTAQHGIPGKVEFKEGPGGLTVAELAGQEGAATVALQGAQVLTWAPRGMAPVIWLPQDVPPMPGRAIRGGVPICWPWFGPHASEPTFPSHGFARTARWNVVSTEAPAGRDARMVLSFEPADEHRELWPHAAAVECRISLDGGLELELTTYNRASSAIALSEALHAYFSVSEVGRIAIHGLDGCAFLDKVDGGVRKQQSGPVTVSMETDRVYVDTVGDCVIEDPGLGRRIRVSKQGSNTTVVWNPWVEKAAKLGDLGDAGYLHMVCLETANAAQNTIMIPPGQEHRMTARYEVEAL